MKKLGYFALRFTILLSISLIILKLITSSGYGYEMNYSQNPTVGQLVTIEVDTTYNNQLYQPYSLSMTIFNKYNKSETYEYTELPSYADGKFLVAFTPRYSGDYIVKLEIVPEENAPSLYYEMEFNVQ